MARLRINFIGGKVSDDPFSSGSTTLNSESLAALPLIGSPDYAALILDPDGVYGSPEIVWVTAHGSTATSATVLRGQESTIPRSHYNDTFWIHAPTVLDFTLAELGGKIYLANNFQ